MCSSRRFLCAVVHCFVLCFLSVLAAGQVRPLITRPVNEAQLAPLAGNVHPLARAEFDRGAAPADLPMERMLLLLNRSPEQESALRGLLDQQQDSASPRYHQWLTPEQFGAQFGPADSDLQAVTAWLQSHGLAVTQVSKGRTVIEFSGTAGQVQQAFHTAIHKFVVKGESHWANVSDPQIPAALSPAVGGIVGLQSFFKQPMNHFSGAFSRSRTTGQVTTLDPLFSFPYQYCTEANYCFAVGPYDFATIYNLLPLWNAGTNGSGQTIAIVGRTNIDPQDAHNFRALFGLSANDPTVILNGPDPGINQDEGEADIDVQWSGAAAPGAKIDLVISASTETTDGVDLSALYVVDNNLAGVMSESYGQCEFYLGAALNQFYGALWEQAAAQGITAFVSSGDNGSAGCDYYGAAQNGLQVSGLASTPFNVAVGGTDFNDFSNPLTYWNTTNNSTNHASAKGYVPETTWNDTCTNALFGQLGYSTDPETNCNDGQLYQWIFTVAGSGGKSSCTNGTPLLGGCTGGYPKPSWQTGTGVPNDASRDLPDVSLFASNGFVGSFYIVCQGDAVPSAGCDLNAPYGNFAGYGGTSVASPAFAGIMALLDQKNGGRQGNANYKLYKLAAKTSASCASKGSPASSCTFYDITAGTIAPPCAGPSPDCVVNHSGDYYGILSGYSAAAGYDLATGLGSVNAANLVNNWNSVTFTPSATTLTLNTGNPVNITHGSAVNVAIAVKPQSGSATPSGQVALMTSAGKSVDGFTLASDGTVTGTTSLLPGGTYNVSAHYAGDGTFGGSDSTPPVSVTVVPESSKIAVNLVTFANLPVTYTNTATYGSPYILRVDVTNGSGTPCQPLPTGESACPSGTVTIADNGTPLDLGTYTLNNQGYFEDFAIQLTGGSHTLQTQYAGDASFGPATAASTVTITPASTYSYLYFPGSVEIGTSVQLQMNVNSSGDGAAPTGTFTFLVDGKAISGTPTITANSNPPYITAILNTTLPSSTTLGQHQWTATYSGDTNYSPSSAGPYSFSAIWGTTTTLTANPATPDPGASTTLTATVSTPGKGPAMTGSVYFSGNPEGISGSPTISTSTDANGNAVLQATLAYTPTVNHEQVSVSFTGDNNYGGSSAGPINVAVAGNDFTFTVQSNTFTISAGSSATTGFSIDGQASYSGTATFQCSGLPSESSCQFSPTSIQGSGSGSVAFLTSAPRQVFSSKLTGDGHRWLAASTLVGFAGIFLLGGSGSKFKKIALGLVVVLLLLPVFGCGGGSTSTGGGKTSHLDPGTPAGTYNITVVATSGSLTHNGTFTVVVQ